MYDAERTAELAARIIAFEEDGLGLPDSRPAGLDAVTVGVDEKWPAESNGAHILQAAERCAGDSERVTITRREQLAAMPWKRESIVEDSVRFCTIRRLEL